MGDLDGWLGQLHQMWTGGGKTGTGIQIRRCWSAEAEEGPQVSWRGPDSPGWDGVCPGRVKKMPVTWSTHTRCEGLGCGRWVVEKTTVAGTDKSPQPLLPCSSIWMCSSQFRRELYARE